MEGRHKGLMLRPFNPVSPAKQERRHQKQHGNQTDHNSLRQNEAQVFTDTETHQHQYDEPDNGGGAACKNRGQ